VVSGGVGAIGVGLGARREPKKASSRVFPVLFWNGRIEVFSGELRIRYLHHLHFPVGFWFGVSGKRGH
jgi:hypothetical protein